MHHRIKIGLILIFLVCSRVVYSQNNTASHQVIIEIKEIAVLSLSSDNPNSINFKPFSNQEAGSNLVFQGEQTNNSIWLNYSSIKRYQQHTRTVTAFIEGEVRDGLNLIVTAMPAQGSGKGRLGEPVGTTLLTTQATEIISEIGSCYTGVGVSNGHNLIYNLEVDEAVLSFADLKEEEITFNVVYTLTD